MRELRVLIADDHDVVRRGIRALIETQSQWRICGEASNGRDAVKMARQLNPDVVVIDIAMPEMNGLEATREILKVRPKISVLILTMHDSEHLVRQILQAGARGYVLKSDAGQNLLAALDAVSEHSSYFTSKVTDLVLEGYLQTGERKSDAEARFLQLTARERQVLQLLAEGKSNKEVAALLGISVKTVETHRSNLMRKANLHSVGDIVRYAIRNEMIKP